MSSVKTAIAATLLATAASAGLVARSEGPLHSELEGYTFEQYVADFRKQYANEKEYIQRKLTFEAEVKAVRAHNANPSATYKKGINHLSDKTPAEFARMHGDLVHDGLEEKRVLYRGSSSSSSAGGLKSAAVPDSLDYRKAFPAVLTAVKDQGHCGSCWAHSAIEAVESGYAHKTGRLYVLSQQQLTSCATNPGKCGGSGGCHGATASIGIEYAANNGVGQEWVNGYKSYFGDVPPCNYVPANNSVIVKPSRVALNERNNQRVIMESLVNNGPLGVSVDASNWKSYESGIFSGCDYSNNITINHAVQLVGYGTDAALGKDYWIVRNSWSAKWGENGFMRLARESNPQCGWSNDWNTAGSGCPNVDPNTVWACGQCGILYNTVYAAFDN